MISTYLEQELVDRQAAGGQLTGDEARRMVNGLHKYIRETEGESTPAILLLAAVGSRYWEDVWDILSCGQGVANGEAAHYDC